MNDKSKRAQSKDMSHRQNEGKGNKTAARRYNQAKRQFVDGKVEERAHAAERALDSAERRELEHAELVGKRHTAEQDPAVRRR